MEINIEVPDLSTTLIPPIDAREKRVLHRATIADLYFEENDEIEKGELFAVLFNENGTCEITAPASGILEPIPKPIGRRTSNSTRISKPCKTRRFQIADTVLQ